MSCCTWKKTRDLGEKLWITLFSIVQKCALTFGIGPQVQLKIANAAHLPCLCKSGYQRGREKLKEVDRVNTAGQGFCTLLSITDSGITRHFPNTGTFVSIGPPSIMTS